MPYNPLTSNIFYFSTVEDELDNLRDDADVRRDVLAVVGEYSAAIGSRKRGGVRMWAGKDGDLEFAIDVPNTDRGRALAETMDVGDMYARPVLDTGASTFRQEGQLARYTAAMVRGLAIGPTDFSKGRTSLRRKLGADDDMPETPRERPQEARRARLWLPRPSHPSQTPR